MAAALARIWRWLGLGLIALAVWWAVQTPPAALRGTWESRGYGLVFDIGRLGVDIYRRSPVDCVPWMSVPANRWLLRSGAGYDFRAEDGVLHVAVDGIAGDILADAAPLPEACLTDAPLSPAEAYDVVWSTFDRHYPFFDLHGVDWAARAIPEPAPVDAETLGEALRTAMAGLDDPHVALFAGGRIWSPAQEPGWSGEIEGLIAVTNAALTEPTHLEPAALTHGWLDGLAYLRLDHVDPPRGFGTGPEDRARALMGPLAETYAEAEGIILDLRWNRGGSDRAAMGYAGLFAAAPWRFGTKAAQIAPGRFTGPVALTVAAEDPAAFAQPVVVLTSARTTGAAEVLALALSELPQVTVLGEATSGAFSERMLRPLPGEMGVSLSHQVYRDGAGVLLEGRGVVPDVLHPVDRAAFTDGRDTALEAAIGLLEQGG